MTFISLFDKTGTSFALNLLATYMLLLIVYIKPKSEPEDPRSDYVKQEAKRCLDITQKIEKLITEKKKKLRDLREDERLIADRERTIRKFKKSSKSQTEMDAELQKLDATIFKDILARYPEKQRKKKAKKNVLDKDQKEIPENKPKRRSKKNLEDNSNK